MDAICEVFNISKDGDISIKQYYSRPEPIKVIHHPPATIVFWDDGTKTVVKCQDMIGLYDLQKYMLNNMMKDTTYKEKYDKEKGLALAFFKKMYGNTGKYYEYFKKFC